MLLHSRTKGKDVGALIFYTADHINHGINSLPVECPELRVDFAKVNEMAGVKAVECTDYVAACSYLSTALSLLPTDHWQRYYDQSLRLSFLSAKSSYSCGDVEGAQDILGEILDHCVCLEDKLDSYFLLVTSECDVYPRFFSGNICDCSVCHFFFLIKLLFQFVMSGAISRTHIVFAMESCPNLEK